MQKHKIYSVILMQSAKNLRSWGEKAISKVVTIMNKTLKLKKNYVSQNIKHLNIIDLNII